MAGIFDKINSLKEVMDYRLTRQGVISSNVANVDTPGYKAQDISFEQEFESRLQLSTTNPAHKHSSRAAIKAYESFSDPHGRIGNDGNTVDIDREMMKLAQNQLLYNAASQDLANKIKGLKEAIRGIA